MPRHGSFPGLSHRSQARAFQQGLLLFLGFLFLLDFLPPPPVITNNLLSAIWDSPYRVKEGEAGEVPVVHVLGDIDCLTVPSTRLKTDPHRLTGDLPERGLFV